MRKEILRLLEKGKEFHEQLISANDESLPANIVHEVNTIVEVKLPGNINGLLVILNADARSKKYQPITNLQQAIELFHNTELQQDIDKATVNKELAGLSACQDCFMTIHEIFDATKCEIKSLVDDLKEHAAQCRTLQL